MKVRIQAVVEGAKKPGFEFAGPTVTLGRDTGCDLPMPGTANVSGRHAQITLSPEGASLMDLQSTNGTFLNDRRIEGRKQLRKGDYFRLGQTGPCFQVIELDLTNAAAAPAVVGTAREKAASPPGAYEQGAAYRAPAPRPPAAKILPAAQAPESTTAAKPAAAPGHTRLMVVELQKKNRTLMIGVATAVLALVFFGGATALYFSWKTADLDSKVGKSADGERVSDELRKSTVWINNYGEKCTGSGMLVNAEDRIVVTNYHVVAQPRLLKLADLPGQLTKANPSKVFKVKLPAKFNQIDMRSDQLFCRWEVVEAKPKGELVGASDGGESGRNARSLFEIPYEGEYFIVASSRNGGMGNFKLTVSQYIQDVTADLMVNFPEFTNAKVIAEKGHYRNLHKVDPEKYRAKVLAWSDSKDLAVLKLNHVPSGVHAVPLAKESAKSGQAVHSVGSPGASESLWVYTSGTVRTPEAYQKRWLCGDPDFAFRADAWIIETQSPINSGDSGGPMVNNHNELVAVTQGTSRRAQAMNYFIDVREVRAMLKDNNIRWKEK